MNEQTQEQKILHCTHRHPDGKSAWKQEYYGIACELCGLFYPDNSNWFAPDNDEDEYHPYDCICEDCLQNHPERDILYGDGTYFNYPEDDEQTPETCPHCGKEIEDFSDIGCEYCDARYFNDQPTEDDCS